MPCRTGTTDFSQVGGSIYLVLSPPGLAAGFSITSLAIRARCAVSGRHAFVRQGSWKGLNPQSAFAWGLQVDHLAWQGSKAAPRPPLVGLYVCLHCLWQFCCVAISWLGLLGLASVLFPSKRGTINLFSMKHWCKAAGELSFLCRAPCWGPSKGGVEHSAALMHELD